ncbi:MAG TPA: PorP/SprF family type IX secretion system membrane protein [Chitinophagales bacterium]|nr:PorP/SprF family type IX secretion system membrane protein [Chitinophagales bacterium]
MKKLPKSAPVVVLALALGLGAMAQDPHFSQYNASPLNVNPAMTGMFNGNYRITAIYRSQWNSILKDEAVPMFRTFSASFDLRIPVPSNKDAFGLGVSFMNDKAGEAEFGTNGVSLNLAYLKALDQQGKNFLSAGFQGGVNFRSINYANLRFGSQFDGTGFNPTLSPNETFGDDHFTFFDIGAGIFWYYFPKKRTNYWAGFAVSHLNRPDQSFYEGDDAKLFMRYTGTGGIQVPLGGQLDLLPSFLIMSQGPAFETQIGTFLKLLFESNKPQGNAFYIGPWYRIVRGEDKAIASDALILATRFDFASFSLGFAYDLNFSELTAATNSRGAFEVSALHVGAFKSKPKAIYCPRF